LIDDPTVSVVVPVFNTKAYLDECLNSLLGQTLAGVEVICVDNGSTDGSYAHLKTYAERHAKVTVMRHPEGRQGEARNAGINNAKGRYLGFVDSDDFVSPDMFQAMVDAAEADRAEAVICNMGCYHDDGGYGDQVLASDLVEPREPFSIQERPRLLRNLTICNKLFSRELIERHQLRFPEGFFEDQYFVIAALAAAPRSVTLPDCFYHYRKAAPGFVKQYRGGSSLDIFHVMEMVMDFLDDRGMGEALKPLIDEVKVLKCLKIYPMTERAFQRAYFRRMKAEFRATEVEADSRILSSSERREYRVILRSGHASYRGFLLLRFVYGRLRQGIARSGRFGPSIRGMLRLGERLG
jgi:CDP-glycerol glycerophosphotransferase